MRASIGKGLFRVPGVVVVLSLSKPVLADQFHYNNFLVGDRAIGLGGAYAGIADDASGVYYNPAGLAFALSNDVSGSANAFYTKTQKYKKAIGDTDFEEKSGGSLPSFFGGLQKIDNVAKGLVFAFGVYTGDNELKDQDDLVEDVTLGTPGGVMTSNGAVRVDADGNPMTYANCYNSTTNAKGSARPEVVLTRFHRTVNQRASTVYAGGAVGWRFNDKISLGAGLNFVTVDELVQEYQDTKNKSSVCLSDGTYTDSSFQLGQNIRQALGASGLQATLGLQVAFLSRFSFGLTLKGGTYVAQRLTQAVEKRTAEISSADQATVDTDSPNGKETVIAGFTKILQAVSSSKLKKPIGNMPMEVRTGLAFFATTRLLFSGDIAYVGAVKNTDKIGGVLNLYEKDAVTNYSLGSEYYIYPSVPLRFGLFTNNDARPAIDKSQSNQRDHVDYVGGTLFLSWVQPNSQLGAGVVLQTGSGEAQKVGGTAVQKIVAESRTFTFSATHSF